MTPRRNPISITTEGRHTREELINFLDYQVNKNPESSDNPFLKGDAKIVGVEGY